MEIFLGQETVKKLWINFHSEKNIFQTSSFLRFQVSVALPRHKPKACDAGALPFGCVANTGALTDFATLVTVNVSPGHGLKNNAFQLFYRGNKKFFFGSFLNTGDQLSL